MPDNHHYDIVVRWQDGYEHGIFFVSFTPKRLAALLNGNQIPGHRLQLLKISSPGLIEVTARGGREVLQGKYQLDDREKARIADLGASQPVQGTGWLVVDVPDPELLRAARQRMLFQMTGTGAIFLALGGLTLWMGRREVRRMEDDTVRRLRHQSDLERLVAERTEALKISQSELERAQTIAHIGSWSRDFQNGVLTVSAEFRSIHGLDSDAALTADNIIGMAHPDDRDQVSSIWESHEQGRERNLEYRIRVAGEEKWLHSARKCSSIPKAGPSRRRALSRTSLLENGSRRQYGKARLAPT